MFKINHEKFFDAYRLRFGALTQNLVDALEFLLGQIEQDARFAGSDDERRQLAYCLATFKWETAHTFKPIDEFGGKAYFDKRYGPNTAVGKRLGNTQKNDGSDFHGRGFVQLTGRTNYTKAQTLTGNPLTTNPDLAKDPVLAYEIAVEGMKKGWFTGKKLDNYIKNGKADYENARRIINGTDKAHLIADIARRFNEVLLASVK